MVGCCNHSGHMLSPAPMRACGMVGCKSARFRGGSLYTFAPVNFTSVKCFCRYCFSTHTITHTHPPSEHTTILATHPFLPAQTPIHPTFPLVAGMVAQPLTHALPPAQPLPPAPPPRPSPRRSAPPP